ncbi:MAG: uridine kinase [Oscillospiraceae bacterium]
MKQINDKKYTLVETEEINQLARENPARLIADSEAYYNDQVMNAAKLIRKAGGRYKFVLLCGPSASGKTTTAHKLKHRLVAQGIGAGVVSMDNFFMGMDSYPLLPDGNPDMESIEAVDMELLNQTFEKLLSTGGSKFPVFDFTTQTRHLEHQEMALGEKDVLIMEGIHALNPAVLRDIPRDRVFRLYVSVRSRFINGDRRILDPKEIRLVRRMVRDHKFRNYAPTQTLDYWHNVIASEKVNINPYRDDVDLKMDNTLDYEVCVWHEMLQSLLQSIQVGDYSEYPQLEHIFDALLHFEELNHELIPKNSLLREFIG